MQWFFIDIRVRELSEALKIEDTFSLFMRIEKLVINVATFSLNSLSKVIKSG